MNRLLVFKQSIFPLIALILLSAKRATTSHWKAKIPIDLNISGDLSSVMEVSKSVGFAGSLRYEIKPEFAHKFKIGTVRNGNNILIEDSHDNIDKVILYIRVSDGSEYLRIVSTNAVAACPNDHHSDIDQNSVTASNNSAVCNETTPKSACQCNKIAKSVTEFRKRPSFPIYRIIEREPIDVDLMMEHPFLVDVIPEWPEVVTYRIRISARDLVRIGKVKYGQHIIDDRVDGILQKEITVDHRGTYPKVTITSYTKSGLIKKSKYEFEIGESPGEHGYSLVDVESMVL